MESDSESNLALDNNENITIFDEEWNQDNIDDKDEILGLLNNFNISENMEKTNTEEVQPQSINLEDFDPLGIKKLTYGSNRYERKKSLAQINHNMANQELNISKKEFNPIAFLKEVHRGTSYRDLENGSVNLKNLVEQRTEILKNLVKDYFEQFVNSKSTIDSFYLDIKEQRRDNSEDQATKQFNTKLLNLYGPILDRRNKAEKIRITLNILERWKFFFDLPRKLQECLRLRKIDNAVKNYKKGKYLIQSFTEGNSNSSSSSPIANSSRIPEGQQKVFDEVWSEVNITVEQIHEYLYKQLSDPSIPMKIQEKNIFNLVNLDSKGDPVSFYLNQQFQWNLRVLSSIFTEHADQMK
ncbi:exocyst complex component Sec5-domain-containing protein, partial [Neocallimastix sp. 'constans']